MRILICGDRKWANRELVCKVLGEYLAAGPIECVIEGGAPGADTYALQIAQSKGIRVSHYPADWLTYGRAAGPIRNKKMLTEGKPTLVLAFHNNIETSRGTKSMVELARRAGVPVRIISEE